MHISTRRVQLREIISWATKRLQPTMPDQTSSSEPPSRAFTGGNSSPCTEEGIVKRRRGELQFQVCQQLQFPANWLPKRLPSSPVCVSRWGHQTFQC